MRKIILYIALLLLAQNFLIHAQSVRKKWVLVQSNDQRKVFIDTTSIKETPRQVNVWTLVNFLSPRNFPSVSSPVYGIKYNFAFLRGEEKFSLIGAFFYDKKNRLISEQRTPLASLSNFRPVEDNVIASLVYSKTAELLSTGKMTADITAEEKSTYAFKRYSKKEETVSDTLPSKKPELLSGSTSDSLLQTSVSNSLFNDLNEEEKTPEVQADSAVQTAYDPNDPLREEIRESLKQNLKSEIQTSSNDSTATNETPDENAAETKKKYIIPVVENTPVKPKTKTVEVKKESVKVEEYNSDNEYNVTENIWTDGNLFCVQVSAWRSKSKAEKIASDLKSVGYNAFVVKAFIPSKGQNWYRVRIGYFNSFEKAKSISAAVR